MRGVESHEDKKKYMQQKWFAFYNETLLKAFKCSCVIEVVTSSSTRWQEMTKLHFKKKKSNGYEITQYLMNRYIGPPEAVTSILRFSIHEWSTAIVRLQVNVPYELRILLRNNKDSEEHNKTLTLTSFFSVCISDEFEKTRISAKVPLGTAVTKNDKEESEEKFWRLFECFRGYIWLCLCCHTKGKRIATHPEFIACSLKGFAFF